MSVKGALAPQYPISFGQNMAWHHKATKRLKETEWLNATQGHIPRIQNVNRQNALQSKFVSKRPHTPWTITYPNSAKQGRLPSLIPLGPDGSNAHNVNLLQAQQGHHMYSAPNKLHTERPLFCFSGTSSFKRSSRHMPGSVRGGSWLASTLSLYMFTGTYHNMHKL